MHLTWVDRWFSKQNTPPQTTVLEAVAKHWRMRQVNIFFGVQFSTSAFWLRNVGLFRWIPLSGCAKKKTRKKHKNTKKKTIASDRNMCQALNTELAEIHLNAHSILVVWHRCLASGGAEDNACFGEQTACTHRPQKFEFCFFRRGTPGR